MFRCLLYNNKLCLGLRIKNVSSCQRFSSGIASNTLFNDILANLIDNPMAYKPIHTSYGWFIVPKQYIAINWTKPELESFFAEKFPEVNPEEDQIPIPTLQKSVEEWCSKVSLKSKPKKHIISKSELENYQNEALYRQQLRDFDDEANDLDLESETCDKIDDTGAQTKTKSKTTRKPREPRARNDQLTFTHAWNYFYGTTNAKYSHLPAKERRPKVLSEWQSMSVSDKEAIRLEYQDLINSGKDIYKGKVISREEKLHLFEKRKHKHNIRL